MVLLLSLLRLLLLLTEWLRKLPRVRLLLVRVLPYASFGSIVQACVLRLPAVLRPASASGKPAPRAKGGNEFICETSFVRL